MNDTIAHAGFDESQRWHTSSPCCVYGIAAAAAGAGGAVAVRGKLQAIYHLALFFNVALQPSHHATTARFCYYEPVQAQGVITVKTHKKSQLSKVSSNLTSKSTFQRMQALQFC